MSSVKLWRQSSREDCLYRQGDRLERRPSGATLFGNAGPKVYACPQTRGSRSAPRNGSQDLHDASIQRSNRTDGSEKESGRGPTREGGGVERGRGWRWAFVLWPVPREGIWNGRLHGY